MGKQLIITEKPSAAQKIAASLAEGKPSFRKSNGVYIIDLKKDGKEISVVSAVGHLFTVAEKKNSFKYPSFEIGWEPSFNTKGSEFTKKYYDAIKKESAKADSFIVATDYDIEGEVIGWNVIRFICNQKDAERMKFSTLTKPDLIEAYDKRAKHIDWGQAKAGETRHFLDWMYGINISRALTLAIRKAKIYQTLSSGRVQGPALKLLVEREKEILSFEPKKYWQLQLLNSIEAWHEQDKFWEEPLADEILQKTKGKNGKIKEINITEKKQPPPYPFDLTTLQTEAYRLFGITPKKTLDIAQEIYTKGYISYPRTSSQQLNPKIGFKKILTDISKQEKYSALSKELLKKNNLVPNNGKKTDPAHPAIYPTGIIPSKLNPYSFKVYDLIVKRFLATFGEWAERQTQEIKIDVEKEIFIAKGTRTTKKGWHIFYQPYLKLQEVEFPEFNIGEEIKIKKIKKISKETVPPKRYTQASIIKELEKRNLGTKSTRAQIIQSLIDRNYVNGKSLEVTEIGIKTVETLEKYSPEIVEEELTRFFEEEMEKIREDKSTSEKIILHAKQELTKILEKFKKNEEKIGNNLAEAYKEIQKQNTNVLGVKDPKTGKEVSAKEGKFGPYVQLGSNGDKDIVFLKPA
jgi:DNA topoisomerase I